MSWKKMDREMKFVSLQELACGLIAIMAGIGLGYVSGWFLPRKIPAGVRYIAFFLIGWNVILPFLVRRIAHRGTTAQDRIPRE